MKIEVTAPEEKEAKAIKYPRGYEKRFERAVTEMVRAMYTQFENQAINSMNKTTIEKFEDAKNKQVGNYASIFQKLASSAQRKIKKRFDNARIKKVTRNILNGLTKQTKDELYGSISVATGISKEELIAQEAIGPEQNALMAETEIWIQRIRDDALVEMEASTLRNMALGKNIEAVQGEFSKLKKKKLNNAKFVARQQIATYNSLLNKARYERLGITKAVWETARDERVRPTHEARQGKEFDLDKGLAVPSDPREILPGTDPNCFAGSVNINGSGFIKKLFRRRYTGQMTVFVLADGSVFTSTPNHPVLCKRGFFGAQFLNEGDYVLSKVHESRDIVKDDVDRKVTTIGNLFDSFFNSSIVDDRIVTKLGKFHGDVSDSEVDIVNINRKLIDKVNTRLIKKFSELSLTSSDHMIIFSYLSVLGSLSQDLGGMASHKRRLHEILSLFSLDFTPVEFFCLTLGTWFDTLTQENSSHKLRAIPKLPSNLSFAYSALVHGSDFLSAHLGSISKSIDSRIDTPLLHFNPYTTYADLKFFSNLSDRDLLGYKFNRIVEKRFTDYSGHVYNLETLSGNYLADNVHVGNCRCTYRPIIPEE